MKVCKLITDNLVLGEIQHHKQAFCAVVSKDPFVFRPQQAERAIYLINSDLAWNSLWVDTHELVLTLLSES
jgi:hypothetical protein